MKKKCLLIALLCTFTLSGCGSSSASTDAPTAESKTESTVESKKDFVGDTYSDMGDGVFLVTTAGGDSENGNVPVIYPDTDAILMQIGFHATEMNGASLSYIYVDGMLLTKEQLADSQGSLELSGDLLTVGTHKVEVVQYENDATDGTVTTYKTASYEIKEK